MRRAGHDGDRFAPKGLLEPSDLAKPYAVADVCANPAPATARGAGDGAFRFVAAHTRGSRKAAGQGVFVPGERSRLLAHAGSRSSRSKRLEKLT